MTYLTPIGRETGPHPTRKAVAGRARINWRSVGEAVGAVVIIAGAMLACAIFGGA